MERGILELKCGKWKENLLKGNCGGEIFEGRGVVTVGFWGIGMLGGEANGQILRAEREFSFSF